MIKGENFSEQDTDRLLNGLRSVFGNTFKIHVEFTDKIERTKTGKFRFVVSKVPFNL